MSAALSMSETELGGPVTIEDLLYYQLDQANRSAGTMNRAKVGSQIWMEAKRRYELAIAGARMHSETLRHEGYRWSELIDQMMRAHSV